MSQEIPPNKHSIDEIDIILNADPKGNEWKQLSEWCYKTEDWSLCSSDYDTWIDSFQQFWFFMAIEKVTGEAIGCVNLARYLSSDGNKENDLYAVGLYYVRPEWRSSRVGTLLFDRLMAQAGDNNVCLNGVPKMSPRYASKYGFDKIFEPIWMFYSIPMERVLLPERAQTVHTKDIKDIDYSLIHEYDQSIMPNIDRYNYMKNFVNRGAYTRISLNSSNKVNGICCIRPTRDKLLIGPFYADTQEIAASLLTETVNSVENWRSFSYLFVIISSECEKGLELFRKVSGDLSPSPYCILQFTKQILPAKYKKAYGMMECGSSII